MDNDIFENHDIYEQLIEKINVASIDANVCTHTNVIESDGANVCLDCGLETDMLDTSPDWKYYNNESSYMKDTSRCHSYKTNTRSIDSAVEEYKLPESIKEQVEQKYKIIVNGRTVRGKRRHSIIAACTFYCYRDIGENKPSSSIRELFKLTKKDFSAGLNEYIRVFSECRTKQMKITDLIPCLMIKAGLGQKHKANILKLAQYLDNTSHLLNRSQPVSVASAIIYLYLCLNPEYKDSLNLTKTNFSALVKLSDITITKLAKECAIVLQNTTTKI